MSKELIEYARHGTRCKPTTMGWFLELKEKLGLNNIKEVMIWCGENKILLSKSDRERLSRENTAKRRGFKNHKEYHRLYCQNWTDSKGGWSEYRKPLLEEKGLYSEQEYREDLAKRNGYNSNKEYRKVYLDNWAKEKGYKNIVDYTKERYYNRGIHVPIEEIDEGPFYFGICIAEKYIIKTFDSPKHMPPNNPGFDWICKNGCKIDSKASCLCIDNELSFNIRWNNIADYFILSAWDSIESLNPLYVWIFHKDDIVRGEKFWKRNSISIKITEEGLKEFENNEVTDKLEKLKKICERR